MPPGGGRGLCGHGLLVGESEEAAEGGGGRRREQGGGEAAEPAAVQAVQAEETRRTSCEKTHGGGTGKI